MKTITNKFAFLLLIFFYNCNNIENVQKPSNSCFPTANDPYVYPIVPGMQEWKQFSSTDEAFLACQLPVRTLKSISTRGLIDALIFSPLFTGSYLLSSSSPVDFWHRHYLRFNSGEELFKREDAGEALVSYYKEVDFKCVQVAGGNESHSLDKEFERLFGLEFLFTKQEIVDKIGHQKKQELVEAFLSKYEQDKERWPVIVPMAGIMLIDNYPPMVEYYQKNTELYRESILSGYISSAEQSGLIVAIAKSFITEK